MIDTTTQTINIDFKEKRQQTLASLDIVAEAKRLGLRMTSENPGPSGWIACHAIGRDDETPSAGINISNTEYERGYYRDHGSDSSGRSFFDVSVELGAFPDFESAFRFYSELIESNHQNHTERPWSQHYNSPGKLVAEYIYRDVDGNPVYKSCKFIADNGRKTFRQFSFQDDSWKSGMKGVELLPYHLPEIVSHPHDRIFIVEGEKDADRLISQGILATTNPMGAGKWKPEYSKWFEGREVVILADNDQPGHHHAEDVAGNLHDLAKSVRIVYLPGLPEKGDVSDYLDAGGLISDLIGIVNATELWEPKETGEADSSDFRYLQYRPFPSHLLPDVARNFVESGARAIGCDSSFIALPLLVILGAVIGSVRQVQIKRTWLAPPVLWAAFIGSSGTQKSPAYRLVTRPVKKREHKNLAQLDVLSEEYEQKMLYYERALREWNRSSKGDLTGPKEPPSKPTLEEPKRLLVGNITIEALAERLQANSRGLCAIHDELSGWFGSFGRYNGGAGGDEAPWLSAFNGEAIIIDRKTGKKNIYVEKPFVSILGGIQPKTFQRAVGNKHFDNGLISRFLMCCPPRKPKVWTEDDISESAEQAYEDLIEQLYILQPKINDDGFPESITIQMIPEAKELFIAYYNRHGAEQNKLEEELSAAWSKLEEYAVRIAMVLHYIKRAKPSLASDDDAPISAETMQDAIELTEWLKYETKRCYQVLRGGTAENQSRQLIEWIQARGGYITARELQQGRREIKNSEQANQQLELLVADGYGKWETQSSPKGGRAKRVFRLSTPSTSTEL